MEFTINDPQIFPPGTTVKAYPASNWPQAKLPPAGKPLGAATAEAVADASGIDFTGLTEETRYYAAAEVGGVWRYVNFQTATPPATAESNLEQIEALEAQVKVTNLGTDWSAGERLFGFTPQNAAGQKMELLQGTAAKPDEGNKPPVVVSRVLKTPEATFSGDGAGNLAAVRVHTTAVAGSEGQAIGLAGSAITLSSYEAGHSLADAIGGYFLGISKGASTRTGMGVFANGRTETSTGRATGIEVAVDNESETEDSWVGSFPRTKAVHMHGVGLKRSAVGLFISNGGIGVHTGIAAMEKALISSAFLRDDSEAPWSFLIGGKHAESALAIKAGAGALVIGAEKPTSAATFLEVNAGAETKDPAVVFKVTSGSIRSMVAQGPVGQLGAFASAGGNAFVLGTASGDSGLSYAPGKTFHIGANGKTSMFRLTEAGVGFFGTAPIAKPEVTGSRGGNAALGSALEKFAALGLITNATTA